MRLLKAAALAAALCFIACSAAMAQATSIVDANPLADAVSGVITDVVTALIGILGLWLAVTLKKKLGIDITAQVQAIEAGHRDTLHSAVGTWTAAARAKFGPLTFNVGSPEVAYVLNGVAKSAPDAIAALKPTENWIINKAAGLAGVTPVILP